MPRLPITRIIGVGGGGCNVVRVMMRRPVIPGVGFVTVDCESSNPAGEAAAGIPCLVLRPGSGGTARSPETVREAAEDPSFASRLKEVLGEPDLVVVTAGFGGATGTGAAPVVARLAKETGALVLAFVTTPFKIETIMGARNYLHMASAAVEMTRAVADNAIVVENEFLTRYLLPDTPLSDAVKAVNVAVSEAIAATVGGATARDPWSISYDDMMRVLTLPGGTSTSFGLVWGGDSATMAAEDAVWDALCHVPDGYPRLVGGVIGYFRLGSGVSIEQCNNAAQDILSAFNPAAEVFFWASEPELEWRETVRVTLVATGIQPTAGDR